MLGHTHLPQTVAEEPHRYYNPGSWTRYVDGVQSLTLEELKDERRFPYELNCIRVEDAGHDILVSERICIDRSPAS